MVALLATAAHPPEMDEAMSTATRRRALWTDDGRYFIKLEGEDDQDEFWGAVWVVWCGDWTNEVVAAAYADEPQLDAYAIRDRFLAEQRERDLT